MKSASLTALKSALKEKDLEEVHSICLRLAKFKKDNKELLTYLLFEAHDEPSFINLLKEDIDDMLGEINRSHAYYLKKGVQKIVRSIDKSLRYSGQKQTEVEVRLYFCHRIKNLGIAIRDHTTINNLYHREIKRIEKALEGLHEDLRADYRVELQRIV